MAAYPSVHLGGRIWNAPPLVRIEFDNRMRAAPGLAETAQQSREYSPLQSRDEQQDSGKIGQEPGSEHQDSGEGRKKPRSPCWAPRWLGQGSGATCPACVGRL